MAPARLRLCSDDQLVERFRAGRDEAFRVIHDRYRARLGAYVRQTLAARTSEDVEDVLQDVFERAARMLRANAAPVGLRPWLYGVARNRCIDELRRRPPAPPDVLAVTRSPLAETSAVAERRADVERLFRDLRALPELQRSALLMRELQGLSHTELAVACGVSVPAVKSLLVRARVGLVDAEAARGAACATIRDDLAATHDRRVKTSARAARHLRECPACRSYRAELRRTNRRLAALIPGPSLLPLTALGRVLGAHATDTPLAATGAVGSGSGAIVGAGKLAAVLGVASVAATGAVLQPSGPFGGSAGRPTVRPASPRLAAAATRGVKAPSRAAAKRSPRSAAAKPAGTPPAAAPSKAPGQPGAPSAPASPTDARAPSAPGTASTNATQADSGAPAGAPAPSGAEQPSPAPGASSPDPAASAPSAADGAPASGSPAAAAPIPTLDAAAQGATGLAADAVAAVPGPVSSVAAAVTPAASQLTGLVPGG